ncbi:MAG: hypothetical protein ACFFEE_13040 [Candidatus Thorarchaeota archaeon]
MVISKSPPTPPTKRGKSIRNAYISIYVIATCLGSVMLSITGHLPLDPLTALIAGVFAGFALALFQLTYVKFIVKSSWRIKGKPLE